MVKVQVLVKCEHCQAQAPVPPGGTHDDNGIPCLDCDGSGNQAKWVTLQEFAVLLEQAKCPHKHTSYRGGMHFSAGDVWDDIEEVCIDCGANLDRQTLGDYIQEDN
jgi:hypothetical protein